MDPTLKVEQNKMHLMGGIWLYLQIISNLILKGLIYKKLMVVSFQISKVGKKKILG
jgi:hypothetical protein